VASRKRGRTGGRPAAGPPIDRVDTQVRRAGRWTLAIVAAVLLLTIDDRHVGSVADGRQMIWTAIAIAETGEIAQARDRDFTFARPLHGDAVSRYGMGMSFSQLPAAWLAPVVESSLGAGSSQPLFLIAPFLFTLAGAWAAGRIALELGGGGTAVSVAIFLASIASPLGSYAAMEFSEPLQGALLALGLLFSIQGRGAAAGFAAGLALLTKSANLVVAPLTLLPLWRTRRFAGAAISFTLIAAIWLAFEIRRFGAPLANYPGEGFTNPIWDGTWRLLFSVTEGLVLFYPALIVAIISRAERLPRAAALLSSAVLLALAAAYWGWHGNEGWGPRLVLPAIPLLAPLAAVQVERWGSAVAAALVSICLIPNLPPLLQHPTPLSTYVTNLAWPRVAEQELYGIPAYARENDRISPDLVLAKVPQASPFIVYPWFARATWSAPEKSASLLENPPWRAARPDLLPRHDITPALARYFTREPRWNFWGRGFSPSPEDVAYRAVYLEGLGDQIVRMHQQRRTAEALELASRLHRLRPSGESIALMLESYRLGRNTGAAKAFLASQPTQLRSDPRINVVLALFEMDAGNESSARAFLENAATALPDAPIQRAVWQPMKEWPRDLFSMTVRPVGQVEREAARRQPL
jgi:hypothetical protein